MIADEPGPAIVKKSRSLGCCRRGFVRNYDDGSEAEAGRDGTKKGVMP